MLPATDVDSLVARSMTRCWRWDSFEANIQWTPRRIAPQPVKGTAGNCLAAPISAVAAEAGGVKRAADEMAGGSGFAEEGDAKAPRRVQPIAL